MSPHHDDQSLSQAAQFHPVLTGILLQHQRCFYIRKASRQMHVWRCHCLQIAKTPKRARRSDGIGFLSRGFEMDSTGVTRQARLETRFNAADPINLDLAYSAARAGADRQQGYCAKLQLWPVTADSCSELTPRSATPLLHKVRPEVDGEQALAGATNEDRSNFRRHRWSSHHALTTRAHAQAVSTSNRICGNLIPPLSGRHCHSGAAQHLMSIRRRLRALCDREPSHFPSAPSYPRIRDHVRVSVCFALPTGRALTSSFFSLPSPMLAKRRR